ncbi:hypothetical protein E2C01_085879 [Portunus trituberculatus]|uniref:Uncharacterized protein n=1 Tax=Portunus trituberculatus TaxID=210409 RepID=A0A5B7J870_PORTR|nr:hypothetical protein [Portunus trituberculatus]
MLLPYHLRWGPPITISCLFLVLFLQYLLRIPQSIGASGIMLIFLGMITVSLSETHFCVLNMYWGGGGILIHQRQVCLWGTSASVETE